ncbi:MAG: hypothetical protein R2762_27620 [Bryobacteraceae bacterium]
MTCAQFEQAVLAVWRGEPAPEGFERHAAQCAACARFCEEQEVVSAALASLALDYVSGPSPAVERNVMLAFADASRGGQVAPSRMDAAKRLRGPVWKWAAVAACLLAGVLLFRYGVPGPEGESSAQAAEAVFYALPGMPLDIDPAARVMRVRLAPSELRRFGFPVDLRRDAVEADVLVGRDGLPRGVRLVSVSE